MIMATPDQILTALREADRQGNVEDATQLAQMYKTATEASTEESDAQIAARAKGESIPEEEGFFTSAGQAGIGSAKSTAGGIMQFAGAEESGRELAKEGQEQGKNYPSVGDLPALYRTEGLGAALKRTLPAIGYDLARTAPVIGAGLTAGALAPEVALGGLGAATIAELAAYGLSATGENMNRQQAQIDAGTRKEFNRAAAFGSGMAQGVLEKVGVNQILGKAGAVGERIAQKIGTKSAAQEIVDASTRTGLRTAGRVIGGIAETGAVEGGVEALQEGLGRAQAGESLTDREALEAYGSSALGGVLVGGAMRAPFATAEGLTSKNKALGKLEYFGNIGLDVLNDQTSLTPEFFKANALLMSEGIARNTAGSEGAKTVDEAFEELKAKVKTQEQFDTEAARKGEEQARKQAGFEALSQTQLPDEFAQGYEGPKETPDIDIDAQKLEINKQADVKYNDVRSEFLNGTLKGANNKPVTSASEANKIAVKEKNDYLTFNMQLLNEEALQTNKRQQDLFGKVSGTPAKGEASTLEPTATLQVTPSGEALLNQDQIDAQDFRRLAEKQHQELIDAGVKSEATKEMSKLLAKTREGSQVDLFGGKKGTLKEEVIPARTQDFGTAPIQEDVVTRAAQQAKATADMSKVVAKTKEGEQVDLFGGKKGKLKEEVIPEAKVAETVAPKQEDLLDEDKQLEFPRLLTALKGLTETGEGGPDVATLLGKPPTGQRKATDFATAVHAEVGAKDTDVITPAHVAEAGVRNLELGKVIEKAGGLPISDPKVSAAINKLTPEKQVALTNVLSKEYSPENYIKPSEMLVSKQELLNLNIPPQSTLVKDLFNKPKVESINVVNNPTGAKQLVTQLVAVSKNKNAPPAVQAAALQKAVAIEQTLAKVKEANNKAVAAKAVTTKGTTTNIVTKDDVAYSVAPVGITTGHTTASLSKALSPEMKRLVASGKAVLHDTADTLPGTGHPVNVQGMTTADGITHYVANKLTPSTIQNVALHEVGVHAGMRKMLGDKLWSYVKDQAMTNQGAAFVKARASVPEGTPDHLIAEEVLAYLVENSPNLSLVRQIVASIRNFMRSKLGANIRLSEADARQMAVAAMRKESKTVQRTSREETAYAEMYRGVGEGSATNNTIEWVTPDKKHAEGYAARREKGKTVSNDYNPTSSFNAGRDVNVLTPQELVAKALQQTKVKDKEQVLKARSLFLEGFKNQSKPIHEYWSDDKSKEKTASFLRDLGFDSIELTEDGVKTFGILNAKVKYSVNKGGFNANIPAIRKKANAIASFSREKLPSYLELFSAAGIREIGAKYLRGKEKDGVPSKNSASEILKDTREITGMTNKLLEEYLDLRKQINKYIKEHRQQVGILGDTANSATILQVSPSEIDTNSPNNIDNRIESELENQDAGYAQRVKELRALKVSWGQLNPQSKAMYKKVADFYKKSYEDYVAAEKYRIENDADVSAETRAEQLDIFNKKMKGTELKGDYFPIMRFGKYAVEYTDGDINEDTGELISKFSKFESDDKAREFIATNPSIKTKGITKDFVNDNKSALTGNRSLDALWKSVDAKFEKVETGGNIKEIADDVKDYLFQMHLMGRPEQSIAKRFLHRKGTAGYDNDIFRSFDTYGLSMSKQLPRIKLSGVIMGKLENLKSELPENETLGTDYYNAFKKQISDTVYPKQISGLVNTLTGAVFHYYLSAPASAALQLASIPLQGAPSIAKLHGVNAARRALNSAVGLYTGSMSRATPFGDIARGAKGRKDIGNLVKGAKHANEFDIPKAMEMMKAEGLLLPSIHAQAFSGQDKPTSKSDSAFAKAKRVMEITSRPFAEAESAARQVSAVAAYIANMRSGMTHEKAVRAAIDSTYLDLGDFGATGQSSLVKTGLGGVVKVASQFQQYGAKLLFAFAKAGHDALKGESPEVRKQGRKFIGNILAMHYIFAGSLGLPLAGLAMTITDFIRDQVGDDDEKHDLENDMRKAMHDMDMNDTVIKMILDGPIGTLTNMNLTPRIGASDLIPMIQESDLNESLKGDIMGNVGKVALGAAGSTAANMLKAGEAWTEGKYEQAIERVMPAAVRNVMMAYRYATEGKLTGKGLPIMTKEEITTSDIVARALGMETAHMAEKSKAARSAYMLNEFIKDRKQELYSKYAKATPKEQDKVMDTIVKFAERHPGAGVSANSIISSLRGKEEAPYKATRGQMLGKNAPEIEDYIQELEQD